MTANRWQELMAGTSGRITSAEIKQGWHWCNEFDLLLRNSNEEEFKCTCNQYQNLRNLPKYNKVKVRSPSILLNTLSNKLN